MYQLENSQLHQLCSVFLARFLASARGWLLFLSTFRFLMRTAELQAACFRPSRPVCVTPLRIEVLVLLCLFSASVQFCFLPLGGVLFRLLFVSFALPSAVLSPMLIVVSSTLDFASQFHRHP